MMRFLGNHTYFGPFLAMLGSIAGWRMHMNAGPDRKIMRFVPGPECR